MRSKRGLLAILRRRAASSAINYGLIVALIAVSVMAAMAAIGGNFACTFDTVRVHLLGGSQAECSAVPGDEDPVGEAPGEPEGPVPEVGIDDIAFADRVAEPLQYAVSDAVRVVGVEGVLDVAILADAADAAPQFSIAGGAWTSAGKIANGQSLRLRMRASGVWTEARTATVTVGPKQAEWTVTVREQDTSPLPAFAFRTTPWIATARSGPFTVVPHAEPSATERRIVQARLPQYVPPPQNAPHTAVTTVRVHGFDGPLLLTMTVAGLDGAEPLLQRNGAAWDRGAANGSGASDFTVMPSDILGFGVELPPDSFATQFTVTVQLGDYSTVWSVETRTPDVTPDAMVFPEVGDLAPGDGVALASSAAVAVTGVERAASFRLAPAAPPGAAMRGCDSAGCDPAAENGGGWSAWGDSATVPLNGRLQLRTLVPPGFDATAAVDIVAGTELAPFTARWNATTTTDGPDAPVFAPVEGAEPGQTAMTKPLMLPGTVKPVRVSVGGGASVTSGGASGSSVTVAPGASFRIAVPMPAGFLGEAEDRVSVPVGLSGLDSSGSQRDWSAGWTPQPVQLFVNRAIVAVPAGWTWPPKTNADPGELVPSDQAELGPFDRSQMLAVTGAPGSAVRVNDTVVAVGESIAVEAGDRLIAQVVGAAEFSTAASVTATLGSGPGAVARSFTVTTREISTGPRTLAPPSIFDAVPASVVDSAVIALTGFDTSVQFTASGPDSLRFRTGNAAGWSEADWRVGTATIQPGDSLQLRLRAPNAFRAVAEAQLSAGSATGRWSVTVIDNHLAFADKEGEPGTEAFSNKVYVSGFPGPVTVALALEPSASLLRNGVDVGRSTVAAPGDILQLRATVPAELGASTLTSVTAGNRQAGWKLSARQVATEPDRFGFPDLTGLVPGDPRATGGEIVLTEFDTPLAASVEGALNPGFSVNGGPFVTAGTVSPGDRVRLQVDPPGTFKANVAVGLRVGTGLGRMQVQTRERRICPSTLPIPNLTGVANGVEALSEPVQMQGLDGSVPVSLESGSVAGLRVNDGAFATSGSVANGDWLQLRVKLASSGVDNGVVMLTFNGSKDCRTVWTVNPQVPALAFADALELEPDAPIAIAGTPSPLAGAGPSGLTISVSGAGLGISVNGGSATASAVLHDGDAVSLVGRSPTTFGAAATATVTVGGAVTLLSVTTRDEVLEVAGLRFDDNAALEPAERACHPVIDLGDFDGTQQLTVSGGNGASLRAGGGASTTVSVQKNAQLELCFDAPDAFATGTVLTVTSDLDPPMRAQWHTRTRDKRVAPAVLVLEPQPMYDAPVGKRVSTTTEVDGFDDTLQASVTAAGPGSLNSQPQISVNGGTRSAGPVTVKAGDSITISVMTAGILDSWANVQLKVGPMAAVWETYTGPDNVPDPFDFNLPAETVQPGSTVLSNTVTLTGFTEPLLFTVTGDADLSIVLNGTDTQSREQTVVQGDSVALSMIAPADFDRTEVVTATLGPYGFDDWTVRTRSSDNEPDAFTIPAAVDRAAGSVVTSTAVTVGGFDDDLQVQLSAVPARSVEYSRDGGQSWASGGVAGPGDILQFRTTASTSPQQPVTVTVQLGTLSVPWTITTSDKPVWLEEGGALPMAVRGEAYAKQFLASDPLGGAVSFSLASGTLPQGLTLSSAGVLGGTATASATATLNVRATGSTGKTSDRSFTLVSNGRPAWAAPAADANTVYRPGIAVNLALQANDAEGGALVYTLDSGSLPDGLTVDPAGAIHGTPASSGNTALTVLVTDPVGLTASRSLRFTENIAPVWTSSGNVGMLTLGSSTAIALQAADEGSTITFTLIAGTLPTGISLASNGLISGAASGSAQQDIPFTVRATDADGLYTDRSLTLSTGMFATIASKASDPSGACPTSTLWNTPGTFQSVLLQGPFTVTFDVPAFPNSNVGFFGATFFRANGSALAGSVEAALYRNGSTTWRILRRHHTKYDWTGISPVSTALRFRLSRNAQNQVNAEILNAANNGLLYQWLSKVTTAEPLAVGVYFVRCTPDATIEHTVNITNWTYSP